VTGLQLSTVAATSHAGTYFINISATGTSDYAAYLAPGTLTIEKAMPVVIVVDAGGVITGNGFSAAAEVAGLDGLASPSLEGVMPTVIYFAASRRC
jgi:hypothetical protein